MKIVTFLLLSLPFFVFSQAVETLSLSPQKYHTFTFNTGLAVPGADLKNADYPVGWMMNMKWFSPSLNQSDSWLQYRFGLTGDMAIHGSRSFSIPLAISDQEYTADITNLQFGFYGSSRLETTPLFPVQLYVDGLIGLRGYTTNWSRHFGTEYDCVETSSGGFSNWFLSYGYTVGTKIKLAEHARLDLGATFLTQFGSPEFADLNSANLTVKELNYQTQTAPARQWHFQIGINFDIVPGMGGSGCRDSDDFYDGGSCIFSTSSCGG
ncbi:MAG: hypothetical protein AAF587_33510 [Bacteroidota bacterium]